ncbi:MAG: hypothetical protein Kow00108_18210 [Calditrichia bacterium]
MLKPKKKLNRASKKEIKEDKFVLTVLDLYDKLKEYYVHILTGIAILAVIIFLTNYFSQNLQERSSRANVALDQAINLLAEGNENQGALALQNLIEEYSDTKAAYYARIKLGTFYYNNNDLENATRYFKQAVDGDIGIPLIEAKALCGYGDCLFKAGQYQESANQYKKAAEIVKDKELKQAYQLNAALAYIYSGDRNQAYEFVKKVELDKFPSMITEKKLEAIKKALEAASI